MTPAFLFDIYCQRDHQCSKPYPGTGHTNKHPVSELTSWVSGTIGTGWISFHMTSCILSKLEHVEAMNSGSSLNCLELETLAGTKNSFRRRKIYWDVSPFGRNTAHSASSFVKNVCVIPVPGETQCAQIIEVSGLCPLMILLSLFASFASREKSLVSSRDIKGRTTGVIRV